MPVAGNDQSLGASAIDQQLNAYRTRVSALRGDALRGSNANNNELKEALDIAEALLKLLDNRSTQAEITAQGIGTTTGPIGL